MEKKDYRANLELIRDTFGCAPTVPLYKVARWLGVSSATLLKDERFPRRDIGRVHHVPITGLARWLSC